jgi:hypothetical protein
VKRHWRDFQSDKPSQDSRGPATSTLLLTLVFLLCSDIALVWTSKGSASHQKRPASVRHASPPSLAAESVPRAFNGDDIITAFGEIYREIRPQGEYETTEQYKTRLAGANDKYERRTFFFRFKPPLISGLNDDDAFYYTTYSADTQELSVQIPSHPDPSLYDVLEVIIGGSVSTSRYQATNKFGVKTTVTRYVGHLYGIRFYWKSHALGAKIKVAPGEARVLRDRLSILFIGHPIPEKYSGRMARSFESTAAEPTITYPREDRVMRHFIYFELKSVWIYDRVTGKVVAKLAPHD